MIVAQQEPIVSLPPKRVHSTFSMASSINNIEESKVPLSSMGIEKLPEELLEYIFKYVDQLSIASVILTCRT